MFSTFSPLNFKDVFKHADQYRKSYLMDYFFRLDKFILPIYKCNSLVHKTIDLENLLWEYYNPVKYDKLSDPHFDLANVKEKFQAVVEEIKNVFDEHHCKVSFLFRIKSAWSLKNSNMRKHATYDKYGIRFIIVTEDNYQFVWGIILVLKKNYNVVFVKDYLAHPRVSGYSAIHFVFVFDGTLFELQLIFARDVKIKIPHYKYKPSISVFNPYIDADCRRAAHKILEDFKSYNNVARKGKKVV